VRDEIKKVVIDPFLAKNPNISPKNISLEKVIDYEAIDELQYFTNCFLESLRIEPPVAASTICILTEACQIGKYKMLKD